MEKERGKNKKIKYNECSLYMLYVCLISSACVIRMNNIKSMKFYMPIAR